MLAAFIPEEIDNIMMASSKTRLLEDESLSDRDFDGMIIDGEETGCADKIGRITRGIWMSLRTWMNTPKTVVLRNRVI